MRIKHRIRIVVEAAVTLAAAATDDLCRLRHACADVMRGARGERGRRRARRRRRDAACRRGVRLKCRRDATEARGPASTRHSA